MKVKKICAGLYSLTQGEYQVEVTYHDTMKGWVAAAMWDRFLYTDPVPTKKIAMRNARSMLDEAINEELKRLAARNQKKFAELAAFSASLDEAPK